MELQLSNRKLCAIIDVEDLSMILNHSECWLAKFKKNRVGENVLVAVYAKSKAHKRKTVYLARLILNYYGPLHVDHIDRNPLNNQKSNLRVVTRQQNRQNSGPRRGSSSKYKCVFKSSRQTPKPWCALVEVNDKQHYGGVFATEEEAALKANELLKLHHGDFAYQNIIDL